MAVLCLRMKRNGAWWVPVLSMEDQQKDQDSSSVIEHGVDWEKKRTNWVLLKATIQSCRIKHIFIILHFKWTKCTVATQHVRHTHGCDMTFVCFFILPEVADFFKRTMWDSAVLLEELKLRKAGTTEVSQKSTLGVLWAFVLWGFVWTPLNTAAEDHGCLRLV